MNKAKQRGVDPFQEERALPPIEELLTQLAPEITRSSLQRNAQVGELRTVLANAQHHSSHGCTRILFNIAFTSTILELKRRNFSIEVYDREPGYVISWDQEPPPLETLICPREEQTPE